MRNGNKHFLWIPRTCKCALRFMNHVIYCVWYALKHQGFSTTIWQLLAHTAKYTDKLRSRFFEEVLMYWYPSGTQLPAMGRPKRQHHQLQWNYLAAFLILMFNRDSPVPPADGMAVRNQYWNLDHTTFDWNTWSAQCKANEILFGILPNMDTDAYQDALKESRGAGISLTPLIELEPSSWINYVCQLIIRLD
ncbi:hypothetical protein EV363DRAFT_1159877 [Boletus edulis]|nr:hypothetical protein EV363DRAFT_1159877 [Boletus edulis]